MSTLLSINNYHYYRGGAETVFLEHNRMFEALGWQVGQFCMQHPKNLPSAWSQYFIDEIEFGTDYSLAKKLRLAPKVIYSFEARRKLARLLDALRPDVAHAHNLYNHISPSILSLLKARGVPTVLTVHDLKIACPAYQMLAPDGICERCKGGAFRNVLLQRCVKGSALLSGLMMLEAQLHSLLGSYRDNVSRFVVPSRFYIDKLIEWGMPAKLFTHVPNVVDSSLLQPDFAPGKSFVFFGRIAKEKGIPTLVRAAAAAQVPLRVVGTGPQLAELQASVEKADADVEFLGFQTGAALHTIVRSARAVVIPSEWYENAPMSVLEAYGLGKPVIGARIGGIPELLKEGETGVGFESGSVESLAACLRAFSSLPDAQVSDMGRAARRWVQEQFSAEQYEQRMLALYAELGVNAVARAS